MVSNCGQKVYEDFPLKMSLTSYQVSFEQCYIKPGRPCKILYSQNQLLWSDSHIRAKYGKHVSKTVIMQQIYEMYCQLYTCCYIDLILEHQINQSFSIESTSKFLVQYYVQFLAQYYDTIQMADLSLSFCMALEKHVTSYLVSSSNAVGFVALTSSSCVYY